VIETVVRQFEAFARNGGSRGPAWLAPLRRRGLERFREVGYPSPKDEEWRFTPTAPIARAEFGLEPSRATAVSPSRLEPFVFGRPEWPRLVFVDGRFAPGLSVGPSHPGVRVCSLGEALESASPLLEGNLGRHAGVAATPFTALNTAFMREGGVVEVRPGAVLAEPIHLLFLATESAAESAAHPRVLILVGEGARAQLIESYLTIAPGTRYFTNAVTEVVVGPDAWVEHGRIQRESEAAYHVAFTQVEQARGSHYRSFSLAMGGAISRHNLHVRLGQPGIESLLYGLYLGHGEQLIDNHTAIFHDERDCRSWEVYKGLLDDRSHGVFNGKIFVKPEAQKTDAKQTNRVLLLSETASVDTKPQLEIFADDVKCTHGAAVGQLDAQAAFYLQTRGMPRVAASRLLTYAFAAEVLNEVASEPVRAALDGVVQERLAGVG
jgi:Fe-S cluster assembly protein SufD